MINGLDISLYQEQPEFNRFIDWVALKSDPLQFRFIWIKSSEGELAPGENGAYSMSTVVRQVKGAKSVGFEAINLYHFYYYRLPMGYDANGNYIWQTLDNNKQVEAFYQSYLQSGCDVRHPMVDLEDPYITQFLLWSDTESINKAIQYAIKLARHIKDYLEKMTRRFGVKPDGYSGWWWLRKFVTLLLNNGYANEVEFLKDYNWILADYDGELNYPEGITLRVIAWQRTSQPRPYVKGIPTGKVAPGDSLDIDQWMLSEEEYNLWAKGESNMAGTYKFDVPQKDRSTFILLSDEDKSVNMDSVTSDYVMLKMGGQDGPDGKRVYYDSAFKIRASRAKVPVIGWFNLDTNYTLWLRSFMLDPFKKRIWQENETLEQLCLVWRTEEFTHSQWTSNTMNFKANDGKWVDLKALVFYMDRVTTNPGGEIPGMWQLATLNDQVRFLKEWMNGGFIPTIPIYLAASPEFLQKYDIEGDHIWREGLNSLNIDGVLMIQTGAYTETPMALPFTTLEQVFEYRPPETFTYTFTPYGKNAFAHLYSYNRFIATAVGPATLAVGVFCDTVANIDKVLKVTRGIITPPPVDNTLEERVVELEKAVVDIREQNLANTQALQIFKEALVNWIKSLVL